MESKSQSCPHPLKFSRSCRTMTARRSLCIHITYSIESSMRRTLSCGFCMSVWVYDGICHPPGAYDTAEWKISIERISAGYLLDEGVIGGCGKIYVNVDASRRRPTETTRCTGIACLQRRRGTDHRHSYEKLRGGIYVETLYQPNTGSVLNLIFGVC